MRANGFPVEYWAFWRNAARTQLITDKCAHLAETLIQSIVRYAHAVFPKTVVGAFERIFGATAFFGTDRFSGRATMVQRSRFSFMPEAQIWYSRDHPDQRILSWEFVNIIVLSDEFYQELIAHQDPNDLEEGVKVLAASPAVVLDLFMWLSYRCFTAKGTESIPLFGDFGLANQTARRRPARPFILRAIR